MAIKLILTDIDGTILPYDESVVPQRVADAMRACISAGIHVGPASGRALDSIRKSFKDNEDLCQTALTTNGMEVYLDGERIYVAYIDVPQIEQLASFCDDYPECGLIYFDGPDVYVSRGNREDLAKSFPAYGERAIVTGVLPDKPTVKVNIYTPPEMETTREIFDEANRAIPDLDFNIPIPGFLNIMPKGWNKGTAVDFLCERLGIGLDEVATFGDAGNDIELLSYVPWGIAVGGATEEAKTAASFVIGNVEDYAVAEVMEAFARGENPFV